MNLVILSHVGDGEQARQEVIEHSGGDNRQDKGNKKSREADD